MKKLVRRVITKVRPNGSIEATEYFSDRTVEFCFYERK